MPPHTPRRAQLAALIEAEPGIPDDRIALALGVTRESARALRVRMRILPSADRVAGCRLCLTCERVCLTPDTHCARCRRE